MCLRVTYEDSGGKQLLLWLVSPKFDTVHWGWLVATVGDQQRRGMIQAIELLPVFYLQLFQLILSLDNIDP